MGPGLVHTSKAEKRRDRQGVGVAVGGGGCVSKQRFGALVIGAHIFVMQGWGGSEGREKGQRGREGVKRIVQIVCLWICHWVVICQLYLLISVCSGNRITNCSSTTTSSTSSVLCTSTSSQIQQMSQSCCKKTKGQPSLLKISRRHWQCCWE